MSYIYSGALKSKHNVQPHAPLQAGKSRPAEAEEGAGSSTWWAPGWSTPVSSRVLPHTHTHSLPLTMKILRSPFCLTYSLGRKSFRLEEGRG